MIATVAKMGVMRSRGRWDFATYTPEYEGALKVIQEASYTPSTLGNLIEFCRYGASIPADYVEQGITFVRAQNIREHGVDLSDVRYIAETSPGIEQHRVAVGDVLITRSGINVGDAAAIPEGLEGSVHGSYSIRLRPNQEKVSPEYLALVLNSSILKPLIVASRNRSAQPNINIAELKVLQIPLPPRPIQERIAQVMQDAYAARRAKLAEAEQISSQISDYILQQLNVNLAAIERKRTALTSISAIAGKRFDFEAVVTMGELKLSLAHATTLRDVVSQVNERILPVESCPEDDIHYIGLADIESHTGELVHFTPTRGTEILSSSPVFQKDDILFGRMRPYLNKVWLATFNGVCSGEAIVLRPDLQKVDPGFLHALLLSRITLDQVVPLQSGTSLPRVSASDVLSIKLPIPSDMQLQTALGQEVTRRRTAARRLRAEAESVVAEAKARVERMILGEEAP